MTKQVNYKELLDRLGRLAVSDPVAAQIIYMHHGGMSLLEALMLGAEHWSENAALEAKRRMDEAIATPPSRAVGGTVNLKGGVSLPGGRVRDPYTLPSRSTLHPRSAIAGHRVSQIFVDDSFYSSQSTEESLLAFYKKEDALVQRMLAAWDKAWGEPAIATQASRPSSETRISFCNIDLDMPAAGQPSTTSTLHSRIVGLCPAHTPIGAAPDIKVFASDHIDADGNVKPMPESARNPCTLLGADDQAAVVKEFLTTLGSDDGGACDQAAEVAAECDEGLLLRVRTMALDVVLMQLTMEDFVADSIISIALDDGADLLRQLPAWGEGMPLLPAWGEGKPPQKRQTRADWKRQMKGKR